MPYKHPKGKSAEDRNQRVGVDQTPRERSLSDDPQIGKSLMTFPPEAV